MRRKQNHPPEELVKGHDGELEESLKSPVEVAKQEANSFLIATIRLTKLVAYSAVSAVAIYSTVWIKHTLFKLLERLQVNLPENVRTWITYALVGIVLLWSVAGILEIAGQLLQDIWLVLSGPYRQWKKNRP